MRKPAPPPVFGSKSAPISMTPPLVAASWVKSMVRLNGSHVEPSMLLNPVKPLAIDRRQKRDAMIGTCHIEIDSRDVSEVAAVLMSLKKEMPAIIIPSRGTTRIMI